MIARALKPKVGMTSFAYVKAKSKFSAAKIWSVNSDWESLIKKENFPKAIALSMTANRITGRKEVAKLLHKYGRGFCYVDIRQFSLHQLKTRNKKQDLK